MVANVWRPVFDKMLYNSCLDKRQLCEYIHTQYWKGIPLKDIAKHLGVSTSSVMRFCKYCGVEIRNKQQAIREVHNKIRGRKWTNEEARKNVSEGVKKSYTKELRQSRSNSNSARWQSWDDKKRKSVVMNGLNAMHKVRHNKRSRRNKEVVIDGVV